MRLTIAEFAKKYGADKAFILENLETVFAPYVVKEKGLTMLDEKAVEALQPPEAEEQHTEPEAQRQEVEPPAIQEEQTEAELEEARAQIAQLKAELEAERESKKETEKRLLDMMDKVLELTENAQKLTAMANNRLLLEDGSKERRPGFFKRLFGKKEKPLP